MPFWGGWSTGTSQIAELLPYIQALTWYAAGPGKINHKESARSGNPNPSCHVHIITDNANMANAGNRVNQRSTYSWLWESITALERMGYVLKWHWVARDRIALNKFVDHLSREARLSMEKVQADVEKKLGMPIDSLLYELNPTEKENAGEICSNLHKKKTDNQGS